MPYLSLVMEQHKHEYKPAEKLKLREFEDGFPKVFKSVECPSCRERVNATDINLDKSLAKCSNCHVLFSIEEEVAQVLQKEDVKQTYLRPEGIEMFSYKGELDFTMSQTIQGVDLFVLLILPMLSVFAILLTVLKGFTLFVTLPMTLASIYYIYKWITYSKHKLHVDINQETLSVRYRPNNFKKDKTYRTSDIDQLYLVHAPDGTGYYRIKMVVNGVEGQKHVSLLTATTLAKAKYLEQEIERYLKIEDRKVDEATA